MEEPDLISAEELRDSIDAEVKRISDLFRFVLKYQRHFQPSGVEFSGLREYLPSDDASRIDWKNSATGENLYVKQYEEELDMDVFIILDASDTMMFGTADKLKSEYSAVLASTLAYASVEAGIDVGFTMYGDGQEVFISPEGGRKQYRNILQEVTKREYYGGSLNLETALKDVIGRAGENTAIFLISDLLELEGEWESKVKLANSKFRHFMAVMLRDLRDYRLPEAGNFRFEDPSGEGSMVADTNKVKEEFDSRAEEQEKRLEEKFKGSGAGFMKIDTRDSFAAEFSKYFEMEERNW